MAGILRRRFCVGVATYDLKLDAGIAALLDERTRVVWVESPGSATFEVQDVPLIARLAHARGALVAADNTWATPHLGDATRLPAARPRGGLLDDLPPEACGRPL